MQVLVLSLNRGDAMGILTTKSKKKGNRIIVDYK